MAVRVKRLILLVLVGFAGLAAQAQDSLLPIPVLMRCNSDAYLLNFPEGKGKSLLRIHKGETVTILGKSGDYYYCEIQKKRGYLPKIDFDPGPDRREGPLQKGMSPVETRRRLGAPDQISRHSSEGKSREVQYFEKQGLLLRFEDEKLLSWSRL